MPLTYVAEFGKIAVDSTSIIPANPKLTKANEALHLRNDLKFFVQNAVATITRNKNNFIKIFTAGDKSSMKIKSEKTPPINEETRILQALKLYPVIAALALRSR